MVQNMINYLYNKTCLMDDQTILYIKLFYTDNLSWEIQNLFML